MAGKRGAGLRRDSNRARSDQIYRVLATEGRKAVMSNQKSKPVRAAHPHLRVVGGAASASDALDFDAVFRRYSPYVASIGLRLLGRDDELDDLVQDVFLEAHRGLPRLREAGAVKGWLARVCVRRAVRRLRRRRLRAFLSLDTLTHDAELAAPEASPEARVDIARLYRELERLPALTRAIWVLRHLEGEALDNIATWCGCSKSTVQRRLREAQAALGAFAAPAETEARDD